MKPDSPADIARPFAGRPTNAAIGPVKFLGGEGLTAGAPVDRERMLRVLNITDSEGVPEFAHFLVGKYGVDWARTIIQVGMATKWSERLPDAAGFLGMDSPFSLPLAQLAVATAAEFAHRRGHPVIRSDVGSRFASENFPQSRSHHFGGKVDTGSLKRFAGGGLVMREGDGVEQGAYVIRAAAARSLGTSGQMALGAVKVPPGFPNDTFPTHIHGTGEPIRVESDEFIVPAAKARQLGSETMDALNHAESFAKGGRVKNPGPPKFALGGDISQKMRYVLSLATGGSTARVGSSMRGFTVGGDTDDPSARYKIASVSKEGVRTIVRNASRETSRTGFAGFPMFARGGQIRRFSKGRGLNGEEEMREWLSKNAGPQSTLSKGDLKRATELMRSWTSGKFPSYPNVIGEGRSVLSINQYDSLAGRYRIREGEYGEILGGGIAYPYTHHGQAAAYLPGSHSPENMQREHDRVVEAGGTHYFAPQVSTSGYLSMIAGTAGNLLYARSANRDLGLGLNKKKVWSIATSLGMDEASVEKFRGKGLEDLGAIGDRATVVNAAMAMQRRQGVKKDVINRHLEHAWHWFDEDLWSHVAGIKNKGKSPAKILNLAEILHDDTGNIRVEGGPHATYKRSLKGRHLGMLNQPLSVRHLLANLLPAQHGIPEVLHNKILPSMQQGLRPLHVRFDETDEYGKMTPLARALQHLSEDIIPGRKHARDGQIRRFAVGKTLSEEGNPIFYGDKASSLSVLDIDPQNPPEVMGGKIHASTIGPIGKIGRENLAWSHPKFRELIVQHKASNLHDYYGDKDPLPNILARADVSEATAKQKQDVIWNESERHNLEPGSEEYKTLHAGLTKIHEQMQQERVLMVHELSSLWAEDQKKFGAIGDPKPDLAQTPIKWDNNTGRHEVGSIAGFPFAKVHPPRDIYTHRYASASIDLPDAPTIPGAYESVDDAKEMARRYAMMGQHREYILGKIEERRGPKLDVDPYEIMMKRIAHYASEQGYDRIIWDKDALGDRHDQMLDFAKRFGAKAGFETSGSHEGIKLARKVREHITKTGFKAADGGRIRRFDIGGSTVERIGGKRVDPAIWQEKSGIALGTGPAYASYAQVVKPMPKGLAVRTAEAMTDLAEIMNVPDEGIGLKGFVKRIDAFTRKRGSMAEYFPGQHSIRFEKNIGVGSIAHEFGHAFDLAANRLGSGYPSTDDGSFLGMFSHASHRVDSDVAQPAPRTPVIAGMMGVASAIKESGFKSRLAEWAKGVQRPEYYLKPEEVFARSFETYIRHKLQSQGRQNLFLSSTRGRGPHEAEFYKTNSPNLDELKTIAPAMDNLIESARGIILLNEKQFASGGRVRSFGEGGDAWKTYLSSVREGVKPQTAWSQFVRDNPDELVKTKFGEVHADQIERNFSGLLAGADKGDRSWYNFRSLTHRAMSQSMPDPRVQAFVKRMYAGLSSGISDLAWGAQKKKWMGSTPAAISIVQEMERSRGFDPSHYLGLEDVKHIGLPTMRAKTIRQSLAGELIEFAPRTQKTFNYFSGMMGFDLGQAGTTIDAKVGMAGLGLEEARYGKMKLSASGIAVVQRSLANVAKNIGVEPADAHPAVWSAATQRGGKPNLARFLNWWRGVGPTKEISRMLRDVDVKWNEQVGDIPHYKGLGKFAEGGSVRGFHFGQLVDETSAEKAMRAKIDSQNKPDWLDDLDILNRRQGELPNQSREYLSDPESRRAVTFYTRRGDRLVNKALRGKIPWSDKSKKLHGDLSNIFGKTKELAEPITLWRGLNVNERGFLAKIREHISSGEPLQDAAYASTSTSKEIANAFGKVRLQIRAKKVIDAAPASHSPHEKEALLPPSSYKVHKLDWDEEGHPLVHMEQLAKGGRIRGFMEGQSTESSGRNPVPSIQLIGKPASRGHEIPKVSFRDATPSEFFKAKSGSSRPGYLSSHAEDELSEVVKKGGQLRISDDGTSGYLITPEGDLQNLFNVGKTKGAGKAAMADGISRGAKTLDAYEGHLTDLYSAFGFVPTKAIKWDDQYAPHGWDYENHDRPDVVFMRYPENEPRDPATIREDFGTRESFRHPGYRRGGRILSQGISAASGRAKRRRLGEKEFSSFGRGGGLRSPNLLLASRHFSLGGDEGSPIPWKSHGPPSTFVPLFFKCPGCGSPIGLSSRKAGTEFRCPSCQMSIVAPGVAGSKARRKKNASIPSIPAPLPPDEAPQQQTQSKKPSWIRRILGSLFGFAHGGHIRGFSGGGDEANALTGSFADDDAANALTGSFSGVPTESNTPSSWKWPKTSSRVSDLAHYRDLRSQIMAKVANTADLVPGYLKHTLGMIRHSLRSDEVLGSVPRGSKFLGSGVSAMAFREPSGDVIRLQPENAQDISLRAFKGVPKALGILKNKALFDIWRPKVREVLQPKETRSLSARGHGVHFERLPFANMLESKKLPVGAVKRILNRLGDSLATKGWYFQDKHLGQVGEVGGKHLIVDPGSITPFPGQQQKEDDLNAPLPSTGFMTKIGRALGFARGGSVRGFSEGGGSFDPRQPQMDTPSVGNTIIGASPQTPFALSLDTGGWLSGLGKFAAKLPGIGPWASGHASQAEPLLKTAASATASLAKSGYDFAENRYGKKNAKLIAAAGPIVGWGALGIGAAFGIPLWLPGSTLWGGLPVAAALEVGMLAKAGINKLTGKKGEREARTFAGGGTMETRDSLAIGHMGLSGADMAIVRYIVSSGGTIPQYLLSKYPHLASSIVRFAGEQAVSSSSQSTASRYEARNTAIYFGGAQRVHEFASGGWLANEFKEAGQAFSDTWQSAKGMGRNVWRSAKDLVKPVVSEFAEAGREVSRVLGPVVKPVARFVGNTANEVTMAAYEYNRPQTLIQTRNFAEEDQASRSKGMIPLVRNNTAWNASGALAKLNRGMASAITGGGVIQPYAGGRSIDSQGHQSGGPDIADKLSKLFDKIEKLDGKLDKLLNKKNDIRERASHPGTGFEAPPPRRRPRRNYE